MRRPTAVDFETEPIEPRPGYPPKPVSVAIWEPGRKPEFWAWGHPSENNCTKTQAACRLREVWRSRDGLLFHNAAFDLDVAETFFGLKFPAWDRIYDTMFSLFLADPNARALDLKTAAEVYLDWPVEDQEELRAFLVEHVPELRRRPNQWEKYLYKLPGDMAATRGVGDVRRTVALHDAFFEPSEAYDRERRLLPKIVAMERRGVPVDPNLLRRQATHGAQSLEAVDRWIGERVGVPGIRITQRERFANALEDAGLVDEWILTKKGRRSTKWENLREVCKDRALVDTVRFRGMLATQVNTFAKPWLEQLDGASEPVVHFRFNQVRNAEAGGGRMMGARTGRLSASPNPMNVPSRQPVIARTESGLSRARAMADSRGGGDVLLVPQRGTALIDLREAIATPTGWWFGDHDYAQQELKILCHLAGGALLEAYLADPALDAHAFVSSEVQKRTGKIFERRDVKAVNFGVLYGIGIAKLMRDLGLDDYAEVRQLRTICKRVLGAERYDRELKDAQQCVTIGGRVCPVEPPSWVDGELRTWEYKLINTAIQGSAADQIKEAMICIDDELGDEVLLTLPVHDEILWRTPLHTRVAQKRLVADVSEIMQECMKLKLPIRAEGKIGKTWRECH